MELPLLPPLVITRKVALAVLLLVRPFALRVWLAIERFGTVAGQTTLPFESAVNVVQAVLDESQLRRICSPALKPPPLTVRLVPTAPEVGLVETAAAPSTPKVAVAMPPLVLTVTGYPPAVVIGTWNVQE